MAATSGAVGMGCGHTWHTAEYHDPTTGNKTATINAYLGTDEEVPNAPSDLTVIHTAIGNILVWGR